MDEITRLINDLIRILQNISEEDYEIMERVEIFALSGFIDDFKIPEELRPEVGVIKEIAK